MAQITNRRAQKWYDERVRVVSHLIQKLRFLSELTVGEYNGGVSAALASFANTDTVEHRKRDGHPIVTKADVVTWVANVQTLLAMLEDDAAMAAAAGRYDVFAKPSNEIVIS